LEAIAALCRSVDHPLAQAFLGLWQGDQLVWHGSTENTVSFLATIGNGADSLEYSLSCHFMPPGRTVRVDAESICFGQQAQRIDMPSKQSTQSAICQEESVLNSPAIKDAARKVRAALAGVHYYRWEPRFLSLPTASDSKRRFRMESSGFGLATCLDDILGFDRDRFIALENRFRSIFPDIRSIKLLPEPAYRTPADDSTQVPFLHQQDGKGLYFLFASNGNLVSASQVSDGVLLVLAYLAVLYLPQPPRVVLVEEPENGIHPKRLQDVLKILRDLVSEQTQSQVILTTHSPYVVDLFSPEEVSLCQKNSDGSIAVHRLSQSKTVREQLNVFTLGEIWTAEGDEALARSTAAGEEPTP
jgi:hypothetical protein